MKRNQSGFTLIEIAIVLVIIGLLLGGVLKGQELITQAKIKNIVNDFNSISVAVLGYQDRYKKFPGEDDTAKARWTTLPVNIATQGNGSLDTGAEQALFGQHLRLAGFITGDTTSTDNPANAIGGILLVQNSVPGIIGPAICSSGLPGKIAGAVDNQFDNGNTGTGSVVGFIGAGSTVPAASAPSAAYLDDANSIYLVCRSI